jgi:2-hydroxychromene-2-carboxylate isomerase
VSPTTFYFDLGSPFAYLTAERLNEGALPEPVCWQPLSLGGLFKLNGRSSWARGGEQSRHEGIAEVERRAREYGLPALRWPEPWPGNYLLAMRAAVFAFRVERGREFTLSAFRRGFQRGEDLSVAAHVFAAAADAGLDARAVERATREPDIKLALREVTEAAHDLGVIGVPTILAGGELLWGDDRLAQAAARI